MTAVLELIEVGYVYPDGRAGLQGCSLRLRAGARHAILGANGAGKTTLLQHLNALLRPRGGQVCFQGQPIDYRRQGLQRVRQGVGLVFQNPDRQLFSANVYEDVSFGPLNLGLGEHQARQLVEQALAAVGMAEHVDRPVQELSFGQKKRVCIAGVLAMKPQVLLLDEPMAGLDADMQRDLAVLLDGLIEHGVTVVLTSHDVDFAYRWADDIHLLEAGRCIASFPAADLPQHAEALRAAAQPLPIALRLYAALAERGWIDEQTAPRSVEALLANLMPAQHPISSTLSGPRFL
jgi:cobalt/nickel transport system ATP-binding protein